MSLPISLQGVRTIALLELRQRLRTSRWPVVMGIWFLIIGAVAGLTWWAVSSQPGDRGTTLYDVVLFFVLGLGMLVVPSLTATSINGDREHGVLATLQTTLLTPADIVIGKLVAAWVISLAFLLAASPFLVWAWIAGGVEAGRMLLAVAVLVFVLAMVCALGLMFSTLTARTISSAVLTYLTVAALTFGTLIAFLLSIPIMSTQASVHVKVLPDTWFQQHQPANPGDNTSVEPTAADCVYVDRTQSIMHTERTWWLLALNPFVVVADAAPSRKPLPYLGFEPLQMISDQDGSHGQHRRLPQRVLARALRCDAFATTKRRRQQRGAGSAPTHSPQRGAGGLALRLRLPRPYRSGVDIPRSAPSANPDPQAPPGHQDRLNPAPDDAEASVVQGVELSLGDGVVVSVEPDVPKHRLEDRQGPSGAVAPRGEVAELPPPQGLADPSAPVVLQSVGQRGGHLGKVVRQRAFGDGHTNERVDDMDVVVQSIEQVDQPLTHGVDISVGTGVGLEPLIGHHVHNGTEAGTSHQNLRNRKQQKGYRGIGLSTRRDLGDRVQVGTGVAS